MISALKMHSWEIAKYRAQPFPALSAHLYFLCSLQETFELFVLFTKGLRISSILIYL